MSTNDGRSVTTELATLRFVATGDLWRARGLWGNDRRGAARLVLNELEGELSYPRERPSVPQGTVGAEAGAQGKGMKSTSRVRFVKFLHIKMRSTPHSEFGQQLDFTGILQRARVELQANRLLQRKPPAEARVHVRVVDVSITENRSHAFLLLRLVDKNQPDAVYESFQTGDLEIHRKKRDQGNRFTAHLAISLHDRKTVGDLQVFRGALECVTGISATLIQQRLSSIGRLCGKGVGSQDGGKTTVNFHTSFDVVPYVERTIREELQKGVLDRFTLEHSMVQAQGFDQQDLVQPERQKLELKVVAQNRKAVDMIFNAARQTARKGGYELIRAHYENEDGAPATQTIEAEKDAALEDLVSKTAKIELEEDMHPDHLQVDQTFATRLLKLLG